MNGLESSLPWKVSRYSLSQSIEDTTDREVRAEQTGKLVKDTSNFRESINGQSSPFPRYLSPTSLVLPY